MSQFRKDKPKELPAISTASLPDIVFMLLFFFMVATVMRKNTLMVTAQVPQADQAERLDKKNNGMYVYIGRPMVTYQAQYGDGMRIQLNDKFAMVNDIHDFVLSERDARREAEIPTLTAVLKIDAAASMGIVSDVKQELRKVEQYRIAYLSQIGPQTTKCDKEDL